MSLILNNQSNNYNLSNLPVIQRNSKILKSIKESNNSNNELSSNYFNKRVKKAKSIILKIKKSNNNFNINQPIGGLRNRKKSLYAKATFNFNSENNKLIILEKNNKNDDYTHKIKISNLLNNAKEFFYNLEHQLKMSKDNSNKKKIYKRLSRDKKKDILYPKTVKSKEGDIDRLYGRMYNMKILNDEVKNDRNMSLTMKKSISNYNNENQNINYINANSKNKITPKKTYSNQIVQTFNDLDNNENIDNFEQKDTNNKITDQQNTEYNNLVKINILPNLRTNKYDYNNEFNNNNIKIAEIKEVFPCYPSNKLIKIINSNKNSNYKQTKFNNYFSDLKNNYSRDSRYYYERFMRAIKFNLGDIFGDKNKIYSSNSLKNIFI